MTAALSADHPLSVEGRRQDGFWGRAGTVVVDSVTAGLVRGRVRAVVERCRDCAPISDGPGQPMHAWGLGNLVLEADFAVLVSDPVYRRLHPGPEGRYGSDCLTAVPGRTSVGADPAPTPPGPTRPDPHPARAAVAGHQRDTRIPDRRIAPRAAHRACARFAGRR